MKKKKIIKVAVIFLMGAVLFLTINKYMLNKDNKKENLDNNNVKEPDNNDNNKAPANDKVLDENNKEVNNNNNDSKNNNSDTNNKKNDANNEVPKDKSNEKKEQSSNNKQEDIDTKLTKAYPLLDKIRGEKIDKGTTAKGFKITEINGVTYIDDVMMVNKTYSLPSDYMPVDTVESPKGKTNTCNKCINKIAYKSFSNMQADAKALGLNIYIASGYRPYVSQNKIYNNYIKRDGKKAADTYSARPGYSEHQSSYAFDLNSINDSFAKTDEGKWVNNNAYLYGFIIRFPKGKSDYTGYKYESWHLRYVGYDLAKKLYNDGNWLSLEEYFGVDSKYQD